MAEIDRGESKSSREKESKLLRIMMVALIVAVLSASSIPLLSEPSSEITPGILPVPMRTSYTSHSVIFINGNAQFNNTNFSNNGVVSGNGTAGNPYIIEGWEINSTGFIAGINIGNTTDHFVIRDCFVYKAGQLDILLDNVTNGRLLKDECTSAQMGYGIYLRNSSYCLIENVNSSVNTAHGLYFYHSNNNTVRNSTFSDSASGNGILLSYSEDNDLVNNSCLRNNENGIWLYSLSSNNTLTDNNCSDNARGIYLVSSSRSNNISSNNCSSNIYYGIYLAGSSNNTIIDNNCSSNNNYGIYLISSSWNILFNNTCSWNPHYFGIVLNQSSNHNNVANNTCSYNGGEGIYLNFFSNNNAISNNTLTNNYYNGLEIDYSNDNIISNNDCSSNVFYSIALEESSRNNITNNDCSSNGWEGIYLVISCNENIISNNNCSNNRHGIYLNWMSEDNIVIDNTCSYNANYGMLIESSSNNNTFSNNTCTYNTLAGIHVFDSSANSLLANNASNNQFGVYLWLSNSTTVSNNTISNNSQYGIRINSAPGNIISDNTITDNSRYGVYIWSAASQKNRIWNNTFYHNNGSGDTYNQANNQALDSGGINWWNSTNGYGNYWADWTTPDIVYRPEIVDLPYNITGTRHAQDSYPLTSPRVSAPPIPEFSELVIPVVGLMLIALMVSRTRKKS